MNSTNVKDCQITVDEGYTQLYTITCHKCGQDFPTYSDWERHCKIKIRKR